MADDPSEPIDFEKAKERAKRAGRHKKPPFDDGWPKANGHAGGGQSSWIGMCLQGKSGPFMNVTNAIIGVRGEFNGKFRWNELDCSVEYEGRHLTDSDITGVQRTLQMGGLWTIKKGEVQDAVTHVAKDDSFHPIREYLDQLSPWDGVERLDWLFPNYFGSAPDPLRVLPPPAYDAAIGRMFMIGMVARIYKPGCQQDHMPVIEGPQGQRKSTACWILAGEQFFGDSLPDISNKDSSQYLRGKWLVEVAEMHVHSKAETTAMKSFVSRRTERYFARYGRNESREPRQCCFIGTTNEDEYLKDSTGGRRFWPIRSGHVDCSALARDRDQLFAEAKLQFEAGEHWWPEHDFEQSQIKPQQEERLESDLWDEYIENYLKDKTKVTARDITNYLVALELLDKKRQGRVERGRIKDIMRKFKWNTKRSNSARWWEKGS